MKAHRLFFLQTPLYENLAQQATLHSTEFREPCDVEGLEETSAR